MKPITFAAPRIKRYETDDFVPSLEPRFVAVSLSGLSCQLQCDHCQGRMLGALHWAETPESFALLAGRLAERGCRGMLLTGGCGRDGTIPLAPFAMAVREAKRRHGFRLAAHSKLCPRDFASAAVDAGIDLLMLDVVGEDDVLHHVYHLPRNTVDDVRSSLDTAEEYGLALAPHVMVAINHGRTTGECRALAMLHGRDLESLVLVVLTPLRGTPLAGVQIDLTGVFDVLEQARNEFPDTRLVLGCAKTGGAMQRRIEEHALALGFDAIAYPSDGLVAKARAEGREVLLSESCCAFAG